MNLVSCIMPTKDRRAFVPLALRYFLRQDYPERELVVVDDGDDAVADLMPEDPRIRYLRVPRGMTLGAKRNLACREARGDILVHWDDDDWMAPWRLSYQVSALQASGADVCGIDRMHFYQPGQGLALEYVYPAQEKPWVAGGSFCYSRRLWAGNRFGEFNVGEDTRFLWGGRPKRIQRLPDHGFYVGLVHGANTCTKRAIGMRWRPGSLPAIRAILGPDFENYQPKEKNACAAV